MKSPMDATMASSMDCSMDTRHGRRHDIVHVRTIGDTMDSSMDNAMGSPMVGVHSAIHGRHHGPPTHTRYSVARATGAHSIFHGCAPWEKSWRPPWCTTDGVIDGAMVESNTMACFMAHTMRPSSVP